MLAGLSSLDKPELSFPGSKLLIREVFEFLESRRLRRRHFDDLRRPAKGAIVESFHCPETVSVRRFRVAGDLKADAENSAAFSSTPAR